MGVKRRDPSACGKAPGGVSQPSREPFGWNQGTRISAKRGALDIGQSPDAFAMPTDFLERNVVFHSIGGYAPTPPIQKFMEDHVSLKAEPQSACGSKGNDQDPPIFPNGHLGQVLDALEDLLGVPGPF